MTLQECKNQVAKDQGFEDWSDYCVYMKSVKVSIKTFELATDLVTNIYARVKWNESATETRLDDGKFIFSGGNPSEIDHDFYTRPKPEFNP